MKLSNPAKAALVGVCIIISVIGFMVKLPAVFRRHDQELHAVFYFLAAGFFNVLFAKRNILRHALIFILLYFFGVAIEYAQEYSNQYFRVKIHGRYDPEDVAYNLKGLLAFSALWIVYALAVTVYKMQRNKEVMENTK